MIFYPNKKMIFKKQKNELLIKNYQPKTTKGFTLIELLLAMAIIAIMSGAILMSMVQQRKRANQSKLLAEFSSVIQPMLMCRSDGYSLVSPAGGAGGGNICSGQDAYGKWPSTSSTDFGNYAATNSSDMNTNGTWYFAINDGTVKVCCNSASSKCHTLANGATCNTTTPAF
jgi:prepilin-type N-terminal cleavage/methylation domain-containing protein